MSAKGRYRTKHREEILLFAKQMQGKHLTANDVCRYFLEKGEKIGTATVYRQLEYMVQEGVLHKYVLDAGTPACFEYAEQPTRHEQCVHCKCTSCGKLIHLHCREVAALGGHITQAHGFQLDTARTVLYGTCAECKKSVSSAGEDEHDHVVCEKHQ